ncbi:TPA: site-specific DNA-methyltransferase [Bacillus wiedmannii]|nr:site-specific DNA-methyltransferase [Bacillus wiedmannii]
MKPVLLNEIEICLCELKDYWVEDKLKKNKVIEDLRNYDEILISKLLSNKKIKEAYSISVNGDTIFKINEFIEFLKYKNYFEDSFTKFSNYIGLSSGGDYLKYNSDVILDFPHKDCVLEAGMTKDDRQREEVFYHTTIAKEEIDALLEPKVLKNAVKYTSEGEISVNAINNEDNLIIKGNNLIALHSIEKRYANKVKMIYIDPPYNTKGDDFRYNDRFTHSTWLTFMKNRLEIAYNFLKDDGSIWVNIDDNEVHYLKVLMDEIFGRSNFIANVVWQKKQSPQNDATYFSDMHDHILVYAKNKNIWKPNLLPRSDKMNSRYKNPDNDPRGPWASGDMSVKTYNPDTDYPITTPSGRVVTPPNKGCWRINKDTFNKMVSENRIWFGKEGDSVPRIKRFLSEVQDGSVPVTVLWEEQLIDPIPSMLTYENGMNNQTAKREYNKLAEAVFSTPKPEKLLNQLLTIGSNEGDLVLDFFMGSATTQAVALKMKRRFIGIEQMDYIKDVSIERLQKVIQGEQGGISKEVGWKGGNSFVYAELYELNMNFLNNISSAKTDEEFKDIFSQLFEEATYNYKLNLEKLDFNSSDFKNLTLDEKKLILINSLDLNQLYLSIYDMEDSKYDLTKADLEFNKSFYNI